VIWYFAVVKLNTLYETLLFETLCQLFAVAAKLALGIALEKLTSKFPVDVRVTELTLNELFIPPEPLKFTHAFAVVEA
jgi:hypothetical protein